MDRVIQYGKRLDSTLNTPRTIGWVHSSSTEGIMGRKLLRGWGILVTLTPQDSD